MGQSTDAILFYGYCWDDEIELFPGDDEDDDPDEWQKIVLRKRGVANPWDAYPENMINAIADYHARRKAGEEWVAENRAAIDAWYASQKAVESEYGIEVNTHCSGECSMPYVAITGSILTANRGYPKEVDPERLAAGADWDAKLDRFVSDLGIDKPHDKPRWWLVSDWN